MAFNFRDHETHGIDWSQILMIVVMIAIAGIPSIFSTLIKSHDALTQQEADQRYMSMAVYDAKHDALIKQIEDFEKQIGVQLNRVEDKLDRHMEQAGNRPEYRADHK